MEVITAREIIKRAKADDMYEAAIPEDDATALKEAQGLVEMAEQAWSQHIRGAEVEAILKLASGGDGDAPEKAEEPKAEEEPETPPEPDHAPPETDEGKDTPPSDLTTAPEALQKSEPWDGYGEYRVSDVTNGLNWYFENDQENFLDLCKHVWAYETSHKDRSRVLEFVIEAWKRAGGVVDEPKVEEPVPTPEAEVEKTEAPPADAGDDAEPEAGPAPEEARVDEAKPGGEDKPAGSGAYRKLIEIVERELKNERLDGIPEPPKEEAPALPWQWADITDTQLHDWYMQYSSLAYYKSYMWARDQRIAMHCKQAADELNNALLVKADRYDEKGKEIRVTFIEAQISTDPNIKRWRKLQHKHELMATQAKNELDSYNKLVENLSRLETMRHQSWERGRK